jgi:hypothetical protein
MQFLLFAKRLLAIASVVVALYIGVGCLMFGPWWYRWLYEGKFRDPQYTLNGVKELLASWFSLVVAVFVAIFLAVVLGSAFQPHLFRVLDRFGWLITFAAVWVLALLFAYIYHAYHSIIGGFFGAIHQMNEGVSIQIRSVTSLPAVQTPIDFHYLESKRIDALYNQLEPELIERQRTVADSASGRAKAGIAAGPANAEAGYEKRKTSTSSYSRPDFSSERKCIAVMRYVVENNRAAYYTTRDSWLGAKRIVSSILKRQQSQIESQLTSLHMKLGTVVPVKGEQRPTEGETREAEDRDRKQAEETLQGELHNLRGLVFLDSVFDTPPDGNDAMLVAEFSAEPHRVVFRVSVPKSVRSEIPDKARLRVFGDVTRPLTGDGYVDIRAIAVY